MAKIRYAEQLEECINSQAQTQHSLAELEINIARAKEEREQLKAKRTELIARAQQATETLSSAPHSSHSSVKGPNVGTASRGFERMEEKIFEWEALAENSKNKFSSGSGAASSIDPNLRSAVDDEIERIRNRKINTDKK